MQHGAPPAGAPGFRPQRPGVPQQAVTPAASAAAPAGQSAPVPSPAASLQAPSLFDQPAQPAKVEIADGKLTVQADNSSLTAIMNQVGTSAGMTFEGLDKDQRIFGTYGPGEPREILSQLLDGSGYNVVMFGRTAAGTPSQVSLSPRGAPLPQGAAYANRPVRVEDEEDPPQQTQYEDSTPPPPNPNPAPGPGAPNTPNGGNRTPQQMLQELQQMRNQQQQQQQNPQ